MRINQTGQRGPELGRRHSTRRLLFLGDSFTMADQVVEEDTFVARVDSLDAAAGAPVEAVNGGVNGYSTYQELAYYRRSCTGWVSERLPPTYLAPCSFPPSASRTRCRLPPSPPASRYTGFQMPPIASRL